MFISSAEPNPFIAKASGDAVLDHSLQYIFGCLVTYPASKIAARPHLLQGSEVAAFMMHASQPRADKLL